MPVAKKPPEMPPANVPIGHIIMPDGRKVDIVASDAMRRYLDELKIFLQAVYDAIP